MRLSLDEARARVLDAIDRASDRIVSFGEDIWRNPEPGYREYRTSARAVEELRRLGLPVRDGLQMTGFRADLESGRSGPKVAIFGEMDALVMPGHPAAQPTTHAVHACGHHAHIAALVGAAIGLTESGVTDCISGSLLFVGCPAEEGIETAYRMELLRRGDILSTSGKQALIRARVLDDADIGLMNHSGRGYFAAPFNGCVNKWIVFTGYASHAASPQRGVNAFHAATLAVNALGMIRETFSDPSVRVHGLMHDCGDAVNIIPAECTLEYKLRAANAELLRQVNEQFDRVMLGAALSVGAGVRIDNISADMPLDNDPDLCEIFQDCVQFLHPGTPVGFPARDPGCTDMGDVSRIMPALHAFVSGAEGNVHTTTFRCSDPERMYLDNARLEALTALELLYGEAVRGRAIAARKTEKCSVEEYIRESDSFLGTKDRAALLRELGEA